MPKRQTFEEFLEQPVAAKYQHLPKKNGFVRGFSRHLIAGIKEDLRFAFETKDNWRQRNNKVADLVAFLLAPPNFLLWSQKYTGAVSTASFSLGILSMLAIAPRLKETYKETKLKLNSQRQVKVDAYKKVKDHEDGSARLSKFIVDADHAFVELTNAFKQSALNAYALSTKIDQEQAKKPIIRLALQSITAYVQNIPDYDSVPHTKINLQFQSVTPLSFEETQSVGEGNLKLYEASYMTAFRLARQVINTIETQDPKHIAQLSSLFAASTTRLAELKQDIENLRQVARPIIQSHEDSIQAINADLTM